MNGSSLHKRKLAEKYVKVQDEWIEACIQWLSSEAEVMIMSLSYLCIMPSLKNVKNS